MFKLVAEHCLIFMMLGNKQIQNLGLHIDYEWKSMRPNNVSLGERPGKEPLQGIRGWSLSCSRDLKS